VQQQFGHRRKQPDVPIECGVVQQHTVWTVDRAAARSR
jgi:hypothetical protein